jgi:CGNR zinc finger/Putative stress-induced transcription regulator
VPNLLAVRPPDNRRRAYSGVVTGLIVGVRAGGETGWNQHSATNAKNVLDADPDIELVLAFLNTVDVAAGTDVLADEVRWREWASHPGRGEPGDRRAARTLRDELRRLVSADTPVGGLRTFGGGIRVELAPDGPVLVSGDAVGAVLAAGARMAMLGQWERVKICAADDCCSAFFDRSRNRSRTWCSMRVCGNRTKARNWRERTRAGVGT